MREFHDPHPDELQVCGVGNNLQTDEEMAARSARLGKIKDWIPTGPKVRDYLEALLHGTRMIDNDGPLARGLEALTEHVFDAERQNQQLRSVWAALRMQFLCYERALLYYLDCNSLMDEPDINADFQNAMVLWERSRMEGLNTRYLDRSWTGSDSPTRKLKLVDLSNADRATLLAELARNNGNNGGNGGNGGGNGRGNGNKGGNGNGGKGGNGNGGKGGNGNGGNGNPKPPTPATGDGIVKRDNSHALWPDHIRVVCSEFMQGTDCPQGKKCNRYCYLNQGRKTFKP
jgi:hypothetical protein